MPLTRSDSFNPPKWRIPGGGVREGEDPKIAAEREGKEETGLITSNLREVEKLILPSRSPLFETHTKYVYVGETLTLKGFLPNTKDDDELLTSEMFWTEDILQAIVRGTRLHGFFILNQHAVFIERHLKKIFR